MMEARNDMEEIKARLRDVGDAIVRIQDDTHKMSQATGELRERMVRVEERQVANANFMAAQHMTVSTRIDELATRGSVESNENRIASLERNQRWTILGLITAFGTLILGALKKIGL